MIYVVAYDISDDGERARVASILQAWGLVRIQRSLFVGVLPRGRVNDLAQVIKRSLKGEGHVLFLPITPELLRKRVEVGVPPYAPISTPKYAEAVIV